MTLPVNELFQTIQGEAHFTGTPAVFIRLQGCAVGCPWCDTKHTWVADQANRIEAADVILKTEDAPTFAELEAAYIVQLASRYKARHAVITGGEPCDHDLVDLTRGLIEDGFCVQVETSGTSQIRVDWRTWVTLSPKIGMPGGKTVTAGAWARADEIKLPVGKLADIERVVPFISSKRPSADVWLQPLSTSAKATELCIASATANGWRLSIQTHKFMGVR